MANEICEKDGHQLSAFGVCIREGCIYRDPYKYGENYPGLGDPSVYRERHGFVSTTNKEERNEPEEKPYKDLYEDLSTQLYPSKYDDRYKVEGDKISTENKTKEHLKEREFTLPITDIPPECLFRLAKVYMEGREKYNHLFLKGNLSWSETMDHVMMHLLRYQTMGEQSEDHLAKAAWGIFTLMFYEDHALGRKDWLYDHPFTPQT